MNSLPEPINPFEEAPVKRQSIAAFYLIGALVAGCESPITQRISAPGEIRASCSPTYGCPPAGDGGGTIDSTTTDPELSFTFTGPNKVLSAKTASYKARPSAGTGPYYFYWLREPCFSSTSCSAPKVFAEGWGRDSVALSITSDMLAIHVTVQIRDSGSPQLTTGETLTTLGPQAFVSPASSKFCSGTPNLFPFVDTKLDSNGKVVGAGPNGEMYYARAGCGPGRIWSKDEWGLPYPY